MARVDTLPAYLRPLMEGQSIQASCCVVCGASGPLNQHHVVRRGAGNMYRGGVKLPKPTLTLCGSGNTSGCHGLAHQNRLFFRWVKTDQPMGSTLSLRAVTCYGGHWEYLVTEEPVKALSAYGMDGWQRLPGR